MTAVKRDAIPHGWDRVAPTLPLLILSAEIKQHPVLITPRIIAVDAKGVKWKLEHPNFLFDMRGHFHELPEIFPAIYEVGKPGWTELWETDSPDKAIAAFVERHKYLAGEAQVLGVHVPSKEA